MSFSAVVLAGGRSTRMGTDKALLRVGEELLLERQLRCLRECGAEELLISGRIGVDYSSFGARVVDDEEPDSGPLAGVAAVLRTASHKIVLVLAVDMPNMTSAMLAKILSLCGTDCGVVPVDETGFQPLAAAYPKVSLSLARRHLAENKYSMREFVTAAIAEEFVRPLTLARSEQLHFANWNRSSDLADLL